MSQEDRLPEFGKKRDNEERRDGGCAFVFDPKSQRYAVGKQHEDGALRLFSGGVDPEEDIVEGVLREVVEESGLYDFLLHEYIGAAITHYHNTLRNINRVAKATCLLVILNSTEVRDVALEEHEKFSLVWVTAQQMFDDFSARNEHGDNDHWIYFLQKAVVRAVELGYDTTSNLGIKT